MHTIEFISLPYVKFQKIIVMNHLNGIN